MRSLTLGLGLTRGFGRGVPLPAGAGIWSSSGTATAAFVGASIGSGTFTAAGAATVAFVGAGSGAGQGVFTSAGVATAVFVGASQAAGTFASAGAATVAFLGSKLAAGTFTSAGAATAAFVGASLGTGTVTWNPSDKEAAITLSNGNLTATSSANGSEVRATLSRTPSSTSYYFEVTLVTAGASLEAVGLANASFPLTGFMGDNGSTSNGLYSNGFMLPSGDAGAAYVAGDVIGVEVLATSAKWYKNGTLVYTVSSPPTGALFPMITVSNGGVMTGNFGATALAHLPSGSTAWDGSSAIAAPTLTWLTDGSDNTPRIRAVFTGLLVGDGVEFDVDDNPGFTSVDSTPTDTLDAGEITAGQIEVELSPLPDGTWYVRARINRSGNYSAWSTPVSQTIATFTPSLDFSNLLNSQYFPVLPL